ncbi:MULTISPECIES: hypothetical protein [unclassified Microcoleus]|uniref:hypothetical protein n=1 Tax=unclassified Microcoleus TaxID=2642155 RepID=UPI0025E8D28B|nr:MULTISPECIES: hypothetical protein [unclassified Microcoleus]
MKKRSLFALSLLTCVILAGSLVPEVSHAEDIQTVAQQPDLSKAVITKQDLPPNFEESPSAELAALKKDLNLQEITAKTVFQFANTQDISQLQIIMGATYLIPDRIGNTRVDFNSPDFNAQTLTRSLTNGLAGAFQQSRGVDLGRQQIQQLTNLDGIGNFAAGATTLLNVKGFSLRMDVVGFQRGKVFAVVCVAYIDGSVSAVPIRELARKLDSRIPQ